MENELPDGWEWKKLGDLTDFFYGGAFKSSSFNEDGRGTKIIRIRNLKKGFTETYYDGEYDESYLVNTGDILIGMDGEFNIVKWSGDSALLNQRICKLIIISEELIPDFAYRTLVKILKDIENKTAFVTVKHLSAKELNSIKIPVPPLETQYKIVAILEKAEETKRQRAQADKLTQQFLKSVFLEMFGDPVTNPKGWSITKLGGVSTHVSSGSTPKGGREVYQNDGIMFIRSQNVYMNKLVYDNIAYISNDIHNSMKRTWVKNSDVLLNITGASIGRIAWYSGDDDMANVNQHVCIIRTKKNTMIPEFLSYQISMKSYQNKIMSKQSGATRQAFNYSQIKNFDIINPPMEKQRKFVEIIQQVENTKQYQYSSSLKINILFNALMQKAFTGELVT